jgi:hypothetical protein
MPEGATFQTHFGVAVAEEYTDNYFLTRDKRENFRSILAPSFGLDLNSAFTKGQVAYTLSAVHDTIRSSPEVDFFHAFLGAVTWRATPLLTLGISDSLVRSDEPGQADRLNLRQERQTFLSNTFNATAQYLVGPVTTGASYSFSTFLGDQEGNTLSHTFGVSAGTAFYETNSVSFAYEYLLSETTADRSARGGTRDEKITGHRFTGTYTRQLTALMAGGITGSYAIRRADDGDDDSTVGSGIGSGRDYDSWNVTLFNSYTSGRLSMAGSVGYGRVEPTHGDSESSVITTTSIAYRFARAVATLSFDSGFSETFTQGQNFGVVETRGVQLSLDYPVTPFFATSVLGFYRTNSGAGQAEDQQTWGVNASATIRFTRWLGLLLEYSYRENDGGTLRSVTGTTRGDAGNNYTENLGRVTLSASF